MYIHPIKPDEIYHFGTKEHSGRYPWGSGERPYQSLVKQLNENRKNREKLMKEAKEKNIGSADSGLYYIVNQYDNNLKTAHLFNEYIKQSKVLNIKMNQDIYREALKYYEEFVESEHVFNYLFPNSYNENKLKEMRERFKTVYG